MVSPFLFLLIARLLSNIADKEVCVSLATRYTITTTYHFDDLLSRRLTISTTYHHDESPLRRLTITTTHHFDDLSSRRITISTTYHHDESPFRRPSITKERLCQCLDMKERQSRLSITTTSHYDGDLPFR